MTWGTPIDWFAQDDHRGSADLWEWPPSNNERILADLILDGEPTAAGALGALCESSLRAVAIVHLLRVERAALDVIQRVQGGPAA